MSDQDTWWFKFTFKDGNVVKRITTTEAALACAKAWDCEVERLDRVW